MSFKKMLNEAIDICSLELKKDETQDKVLKPIIDCIIVKIQPYIIGFSIFLVTLVVLILCILFLIVFKVPVKLEKL